MQGNHRRLWWCLWFTCPHTLLDYLAFQSFWWRLFHKVWRLRKCTKGVFRNINSKVDRQSNDQCKKIMPKRVVPDSLVAPVVLLILKSDNKPWKRIEGRDFDDYKRNMSMAICDTYFVTLNQVMIATVKHAMWSL
jgi:hypothetical protein